MPHLPGPGWEAAKDFSRAIVEHVAGVLPRQFVARSGAAHRVGRIYIDSLRNGFGATTACAWSVRARAGLGVSVPVDWSELDTLTSGAHWSVGSVGERLTVGNAPWQAYAKKRQTLARAMRKLGFDAAVAG